MEEDTQVVVDGSAAPCSISQRQRKLMNESLVGEELKRIIELREVWLCRELKRREEEERDGSL